MVLVGCPARLGANLTLVIMMRFVLALLLVQTLIGAGLAAAQSRADPPGGAPGVVIEGSRNTSIGGQPAARKGDRTDSGDAISGGSSNVFINGKPAATTGDRTGCGGVAVGGGGGVFINGKPAARAGDITTGCPGR